LHEHNRLSNLSNINLWRARRRKRRMSTISNAKATYNNWIAVIFNFLTGASSEKIELKMKKVKYSLDGLGARWSPFWLSYLLSNGWTLLDSSKDHLVLKNQRDITLKLRRKGADLGTLVEIFLDMPYGYSFEGQIVVDVGMSFGDSAIFFATHGAKKVIGIEPCLATFELANENIKLNNLENIIIPVNCALGATEGKGIMQPNKDDPTSNYVINEPFLENAAVESVRILTIRQVMLSAGISKIDFLKMDCEGFEYDILRSIDPALYSSISSIGMEFHNGLQDIPIILQKNGFIFQKWGEERGMLIAWRK
jgi:FkbM family methyltransferase